MNRIGARRRGLAFLILALLAVAVIVGGSRIRANLTLPDHGVPVVAVTDNTDSDTGRQTGGGHPAVQGADYGRVDEGRLLVCDEEADANVVKAVAMLPGDDASSPASFRRIEVADTGGADGSCAAIEPDREVLFFWVCERNLLAWHCGNSQTPLPAA